MSVFTEQRDGVRAELSSLGESVRAQLAAAGQAIVESQALPEDEPYASLIAADAQIASRIGMLTASRERIVAIGERLSDIRAEIDEHESRTKELGAELEPHYEAIGANAFRVFRDNPLIDQEYTDIFAPVLEAHEDLKQTKSELVRAEAELAEKPFLEKMVIRGRIIVLRNRVSLRETQMARLYRDAGRQIAATDFIRTIGDPGLDKAAAPFLTLSDALHQAEDRIAELNAERTSLQEELAALGVDRRPAQRLARIDEEIATAETERKSSLINIATAVRGGGIGDSLGSEVTAALDTVGTTEAARNAAAERLERLEAAIQIERLTEEINQLASTISRKRDQIEKLNADITGLERERESLAGMVAKAEQRRGPVEELRR